MDRKLAEKRIRTLHDAIQVLRALAPEMSAHRLRLESGEKMLRRIATDYEDQCNRLAELESAERKPPQRVTASGRRKRSPIRGELVYEPGVGVQRRADDEPPPQHVLASERRKRTPLGKALREHLESPMDVSNLNEENEG